MYQSLFSQLPQIRKYDINQKRNLSNFESLVSLDFINVKQSDVTFKNKGHVHDEIKEIEHHYYNTYYRGIPVEFGDYVVHTKSNSIYAISGRIQGMSELSVRPSVAEKEALEFALDKIDAQVYAWEDKDNLFEIREEPSADLVIMPMIKEISEAARLAYRFLIVASKPHYASEVYVDAHTGEVFFENSKMCHTGVPASGNSLYNGNVTFRAELFNNSYRLNNVDISAGGIHTIDGQGSSTYSSDIQSNTPVFNQSEGVQAHWSAEQTHDYFLQTHGRDSYDGNGSKIRVRIDNSDSDNAYWILNLVNLGSGNGVTTTSYAACDIVGHEITHGVVQRTANLIYQNESGALNESFADIFGESTELFATGSNDWLVGEEVKIGTGSAFRSFSNPNAYNHPDTYNGLNWYTGSFDNGGVHTNSGVQNHWFYLLVNGGTGVNDNNDNYSVSGIGMVKAQAIAYRNLSVYLTPSSKYVDAWLGSIQSAEDLYGINSPEVQSVKDAWYAVGIHNNSNVNCVTGPVTLTLHFDDNPEWFGWRLMNKNHSNVMTRFLGAYQSQQPGSSITETFNINQAGYYTFYTYDRTADGLINGSYTSGFTIEANGTTLYQGGNFEVTEGFSFCYEFENGSLGDIQGPSIPNNIQIGNITSNSAEISWDASSDPNGINAYVFFNGTDIDVSYGTATSYTLNNLNPNTNYEFKLYATDNFGNFSETSAAVSFKTLSQVDLTPPSVPLNLLAYNPSSTTFDLTWNASTDNIGVVGYNIYVDNNLNRTVTSTSTTVDNLLDNTIYNVYITAIDAAGNESSPSNIEAIATLPLTSRCSSGSMTLNITFDNSPEQIGWELKDINNGFVAYGSHGIYAGRTPGTTESIALPNVPSGDYILVMYDSGGDGLCCGNGQGGFTITDAQGVLISGSQYQWSSVNPICVGSSNGHQFDLIPPSDPTALTASSITSTTTEISWTPSTDNDQVFGYGFIVNGQYFGYTTLNGFLIWPGLQPSTTYSLQLVARDMTGNFSNVSAPLTFTTLPTQTTVTLHEGYFESGWDGWIDGGNDCNRYSGNRAFEGNHAIRIKDNSGVKSSMTLEDINLWGLEDVKIEFEYFARSMEVGEDFFIKYHDGSSWNTIATITSGTDFVGNGFNSAQVSISDTNFSFPWNAKFRIQCDASDNSDRIFVDAVVISGTTASPPSSAKVNQVDFGLFQSEGNLTPIDFQSTEKEIDVLLTPNPANDQFRIAIPNDKDIEFAKIYDLNGRLVKTVDSHKLVSIVNLNSGIYIVLVKFSDQTYKSVKLFKE